MMRGPPSVMMRRGCAAMMAVAIHITRVVTVEGGKLSVEKKMRDLSKLSGRFAYLCGFFLALRRMDGEEG